MTGEKKTLDVLLNEDLPHLFILYQKLDIRPGQRCSCSNAGQQRHKGMLCVDSLSGAVFFSGFTSLKEPKSHQRERRGCHQRVDGSPGTNALANLKACPGLKRPGKRKLFFFLSAFFGGQDEVRWLEIVSRPGRANRRLAGLFLTQTLSSSALYTAGCRLSSDINKVAILIAS